MPAANYQDLAEFGLPLVRPDAPEFSRMVREIQEQPAPFNPHWPDDLDPAAVLLNETGRAVIVLAYLWRLTSAEGKTSTVQYSNLGSSMQIDVLCGRAEVTRDLASFILPGSKRLITMQGTYGTNLDVLPPNYAARGGGYGGSRGSSLPQWREKTSRVELCLDLVILDDGFCVGPDESGLFADITNDIEQQIQTSAEIVTALRGGASEGRVFEMLKALAQAGGDQPPGPDRYRRHRTSTPGLFANMAINRLVQTTGPELLSWFERIAASTPIPLRRPS